MADMPVMATLCISEKPYCKGCEDKGTANVVLRYNVFCLLTFEYDTDVSSKYHFT